MMERKCSVPAQAWLMRNTSLDAARSQALGRLADRLVGRTPDAPPWLLGLGGPPGTGKSTLAGLLAHLLAERGALRDPVQVLSLDDYYLPLAARRRLARRLHPLFTRRGPPGTHDTSLLLSHVDRILDGDRGTLDLPRFDKGNDDRRPTGRTLSLAGRPACVILEGWFVGTPPEPEARLAGPVNDLERDQDPDGRWRRHVNRSLERFDAALRDRGAHRWHLAAPGWAQVRAWRWAQERARPPARRGLADPRAVDRFLEPFERLCRHQLAHAPAWADVLVRLDRDHRPHLQSRP